MNDTPTKLFVYGIFLGEYNRASYGMRNPQYATVHDYVTIGDSIVQAEYVPCDNAVDGSRFGRRVALTGLLVDYDPTQWHSLDRLEAGYDRIIVTTTNGTPAYMYACHRDEVTNHSTYQPRANYNEAVASER